jgi:hypothetical protein
VFDGPYKGVIRFDLENCVIRVCKGSKVITFGRKFVGLVGLEGVVGLVGLVGFVGS